MRVPLAYLGQSQFVDLGLGVRALSMKPNLTREKVSFDAALRQPLRFREAISALHDIVISDLRFKRRDKTDYEAWKQQQEAGKRSLYRQEYARVSRELSEQRGEPIDANFKKRFEAARKRYWKSRSLLADRLWKEDPALWRLLMPCDPIITVADDVVLFECFSADESSYGCLSVAREAFGASESTSLGTTNVDYSWALYDHFQSLRSYRETRFVVDPAGFEVQTENAANYREEKIDLPPGWLRGFMTTQEAMSMPSVRVSLSREAVYSVAAFLKRHRARKSPRALRFELQPGKPPVVVLEPWEQTIVSHATVYKGPSTAPIRIWGTRRLLTLARVLPLAERFDVHLLGTGLPSFWLAAMGEMTLTLGLSGWTTNDWTRGSALDLLAPPARFSEELLRSVERQLSEARSMSLAQLSRRCGAQEGETLAVLRRLAQSGQVMHDLPGGVYRYRQVMAMALGEEQLGPESPELIGARQLMRGSRQRLSSIDRVDRGMLIVGEAESYQVEILVDLDGRIRRGKCGCSHFHRFGIRNGPCRHMIALRFQSLSSEQQPGIVAKLFSKN